MAVRRARWRAAGVRILLGYRFHDARPVAYPSGDPRRYRKTSVAAGGAIRSGLVSESLPVLAGVLRAAPESDALVILGRLMDSMPVPVLVTDCSHELRCVYGNEAWRAWVPPDKFPVEGQPFPEIFEGLSASPLLAILRQVCDTGIAAHLRDFELRSGTGRSIRSPGARTSTATS